MYRKASLAAARDFGFRKILMNVLKRVRADDSFADGCAR